MHAVIRAIEYHLPEQVLTNEQLSSDYPEWTPSKISDKTGIVQRHVAADGECASDLAVCAAKKLFDSKTCATEEVDYIIFCTQTPDYLLPTTACLIQARLGLRTDAGAIDVSLGCSGYVYALGLAKGLIETGQARNVIVLTSDTYTKLIHRRDRSVRTLFGDAAAATLVQRDDSTSEPDTWIGPFVYGTDGTGASHLIVPHGGLRHRIDQTSFEATIDQFGNTRTPANLYMNGTEIFAFSLREVPKAVEKLLAVSGQVIDAIDLFVFHQANEYMLNNLRRKIGIPREKFCLCMRDYGNTVSASIPIALKDAIASGKAKPGDRVMLVGFGVGLSWGATLVRLPETV